MSDHRVHATVWCMRLTLTRPMHSRSGLSVLFTVLLSSTIAAIGSASDGSSSSWLPVEPKSKHRRKCISSFIPQLAWTDWGMADPRSLTLKLLPSFCAEFEISVFVLPTTSLKYSQEIWHGLPLSKTCSLPPPCKMTYGLTSSIKCFGYYLNLQHHENWVVKRLYRFGHNISSRMGTNWQ